MKQRESRWVEGIIIHPRWVSPRYFEHVRRQVVKLDARNAAARFRAAQMKAEAS